MLATPFQSVEFPLYTPMSEARRYYDTIHRRELFFGIRSVQLLGMDIHDLDLMVKIGGRLHQAFAYRFIGILQFDVFSHEADLYHFLGIGQFVQEEIPAGEVGFRALLHSGELQHHLIQSLLMHPQRHLIDGGLIEAFYHCLRCNVAELGHLPAHRGRQFFLGAQHEDVRLDADALQLLHAMLRGLRLKLSRGLQVRHICEMDEEGIAAKFPFQLAHCLKEWRRLDIAYRASDLRYYKIVIAGIA